jgi:hypothetical protein
MKENFDRKLNKHKKKPHSSRVDYQEHSFEKIPIEETPRYKKSHTTEIRAGDIVETSQLIGVSCTGIALDVYWSRMYSKQSFDKKNGSYSSEYVSFPEVLVMWSGGYTTTIDAQCLMKIG